MLPFQYPHEVFALLKVEDYEIEKARFKRNLAGLACTLRLWDGMGISGNQVPGEGVNTRGSTSPII